MNGWSSTTGEEDDDTAQHDPGPVRFPTTHIITLCVGLHSKYSSRRVFRDSWWVPGLDAFNSAQKGNWTWRRRFSAVTTTSTYAWLHYQQIRVFKLHFKRSSWNKILIQAWWRGIRRSLTFSSRRIWWWQDLYLSRQNNFRWARGRIQCFF